MGVTSSKIQMSTEVVNNSIKESIVKTLQEASNSTTSEQAVSIDCTEILRDVNKLRVQCVGTVAAGRSADDIIKICPYADPDMCSGKNIRLNNVFNLSNIELQKVKLTDTVVNEVSNDLASKVKAELPSGFTLGSRSVTDMKVRVENNINVRNAVETTLRAVLSTYASQKVNIAGKIDGLVINNLTTSINQALQDNSGLTKSVNDFKTKLQSEADTTVATNRLVWLGIFAVIVVLAGLYYYYKKSPGSSVGNGQSVGNGPSVPPQASSSLSPIAPAF